MSSPSWNWFHASWGSTVAQAALILATPILSRLYSPSEFGLYGVLSTAAFFIAGGSALRYEAAFRLRIDHGAKSRVLSLCWALCEFVSSVSLIAALLAGSNFISRESAWCLSICILGSGVSSFNLSLLAMDSRFSSTSMLRLLNVSTLLLSQIFLSGKSNGLIEGKAISDLITAAISCVLIRSRFMNMTITQALIVAQEFRKLPLLSAPKYLLGAVSQTIPIIIISAHYGAYIAGVYWMTSRLISLPQLMLGDAMLSVLASKIANPSTQSRSPRAETSRVIGIFSVAVSVIVVFLLFSGTDFFAYFLGIKWAVCGKYALPIGVAWAAGSLGQPVMTLMQLDDRQYLLFVHELALTILRLLAVPIAILIGLSEYYAILLLTITAGLHGFSLFLIHVFRLFDLRPNAQERSRTVVV